MTSLPPGSPFPASDSAPDGREALARRISEVRFSPVRFGAGYDMAAVDDVLEQLASAARGGADLRPLVDAARFPVTHGREGYRQDAVDAFLDEVSGGRPSDAPAAAAPPAVPTAGALQTGVGAEPEGPGIIPPRRGFLARLLGRS